MKSPKGWPTYFTCAGFTDTNPETQARYLTRGVGAIYSFSGKNWRGDRGVILSETDFASTVRIISQAQEIEREQGHPVMPTMVHYTAYLLAGDTTIDLTDAGNLRIHFINLITEVRLANHSSKSAILLNPGFLGRVQQARVAFAAYQDLFKPGSVDVGGQLEAALARSGERVRPPKFTADIRGYCQAVNWIVRTFGPNVSFGWVISPWQAGDIDWVVAACDRTEAMAARVHGFLEEVGVYRGDAAPDFIACDAGEHRDDFDPSAIRRGYAWNATAWQRYLKFVGCISAAQGAPALLWQVPGGHMPHKAEGPSLVSNGRAGSGASFFMGDPMLGADATNAIVPQLANLSTSTYNYGVRTVAELLARDAGFDWASTKISLAIRENIFALYFGGPASTSIVSHFSLPNTGDVWLGAKTSAYYRAPIPLETAHP